MSKKTTTTTPKPGPEKVERFIQTQENFEELDQYLTIIPSTQLALLASQRSLKKSVVSHHHAVKGCGVQHKILQVDTYTGQQGDQPQVPEAASGSDLEYCYSNPNYKRKRKNDELEASDNNFSYGNCECSETDVGSSVGSIPCSREYGYSDQECVTCDEDEGQGRDKEVLTERMCQDVEVLTDLINCTCCCREPCPCRNFEASQSVPKGNQAIPLPPPVCDQDQGDTARPISEPAQPTSKPSKMQIIPKSCMTVQPTATSKSVVPKPRMDLQPSSVYKSRKIVPKSRSRMRVQPSSSYESKQIVPKSRMEVQPSPTYKSKQIVPKSRIEVQPSSMYKSKQVVPRSRMEVQPMMQVSESHHEIVGPIEDEQGGVTITEITSTKESSQIITLQPLALPGPSVIGGGEELLVEGDRGAQQQPVRTKKSNTIRGYQSERTIVNGDRIRYVRKVASDSNLIKSKMSVLNKVDLGAIRTQSRLELDRTLSQILGPGIGGLREFLSSRHVATIEEDDQPKLNRFIDHFLQRDGLKYLGILEQVEFDYQERCKAALYDFEGKDDERISKLVKQLNELAEVTPVYQQQDLKSIDFAARLQSVIRLFNLNCQAKIDAIHQIHVYGVKMEAYWYEQMDQGKQVDPVEIYNISTKLLAELMSQLFSILVKLCEYLVFENQKHETKAKKFKYSNSSLIALFTNFRMLVVDEVGAVGETIGEVMMRIPELPKQVVYNTMGKLYSQINFIDICICRALKAAVPLILYYELKKQYRNKK